MNKNKLFEMLADVQKDRPGWRFCLLGGDSQFAYKRNKAGKITGVNKKKREFFGWKAEFFGHENPEKCTGQRIVESGYFRTAEDAMLVAITAARVAIRNGIE